MDGRTGTPLTPSYTCDPSAAATNPSAGSFGFASAGAPPSTGIAHGLFMPPRMTSVAGGVVPVPAVKPHAPLSKLSNAMVGGGMGSMGGGGIGSMGGGNIGGTGGISGFGATMGGMSGMGGFEATLAYGKHRLLARAAV
nr:PE-PGRS family protein PE_PGRS33-like [Aegilops tauschii subsp. strangulata]